MKRTNSELIDTALLFSLPVAAVFDFIISFKEASGGRPPTIREIQKGASISSTSMVDYYLGKLATAGLIRRVGRGKQQTRNIEVVGERWEYIQPGSQLIIVLDGEQPDGWNQLVRLNKYLWHEQVIRIKWLMRIALRNIYKDAEPTIYTGRVDIDVIVYWKDGRKLKDSSNIPLKLYEDGLLAKKAKGTQEREWGLLYDDSPQYVRRTSTESRIDRANPRTVITITPVKEGTNETRTN